MGCPRNTPFHPLLNYVTNPFFCFIFSEYDTGENVWKKYEYWYPSAMKESSQKYPVVVIANGTGMKASGQAVIYKHLASWGFIVAANEDENSRTGESSAATLDYLLKLNEDKDSDFYQHVDKDNIGIAGHSQGGVGAINAVTNQSNGSMYKTIVSESPTSSALAYTLNQALGGGWDCEPSKLSIPSFFLAGTGSADAGNVDEYRLELKDGETQGIAPRWWLNECFEKTSANNDAVMGRVIGKDHGDIPTAADGYLTAWFTYYLKGDEEAGKAFFGGNAEILSNPNWTDVTVSKEESL